MYLYGFSNVLYMVSTRDTIRFCFEKSKTRKHGYGKEMAVAHYLAGGDNEMRKILVIGGLAVILITVIGLVSAGYGPGSGACDSENNSIGSDFIDEDDDGVCDNWVDDDDDGINDNRLMDGSGNQYKNGNEQGFGKHYGPGDCTGSCANGPHYGNGYGPGNCQK